MGIGTALLIHEPWRLAASILGVAMAVVIMFIEMGFFFGVVESQVNLARLVRGDLVVLHRARTNLNNWNRFPGLRLNQIAALRDVEAAIPIYKGSAGLLTSTGDRVKRIIVYAFPPKASPLKLTANQEKLNLITESGTVLFDRRSRRIYGEFQLGQEIWLDGRPHKISDFVEVGPGIVNDGNIFMSEGNWLAMEPDDEPIMGVVRLAPGRDVEPVRRRIADALPSDVVLLTPAELIDREFTYIMTVAPIGLLFAVGVLAGLIVGTMVCYQILFNEIAGHLRQYATLCAMGFSDGFIRRIILEQAALLSVAGFAAGLAAGWGLYEYLRYETALTIRLTPERSLFVLLLTMAMCIGAGLLAARRVATADPADLY